MMTDKQTRIHILDSGQHDVQEYVTVVITTKSVTMVCHLLVEAHTKRDGQIGRL